MLLMMDMEKAPISESLKMSCVEKAFADAIGKNDLEEALATRSVVGNELRPAWRGCRWYVRRK